MSKTSKILSLIALFFAAQLQAEELSVQLQKTCVQQQLSEHKGLSKRPLSAKDFSAYCSFETEYIQKNTSDEQKNELKKTSKPPEFLGELKVKAFKSCLDDGKKITS